MTGGRVEFVDGPGDEAGDDDLLVLGPGDGGPPRAPGRHRGWAALAAAVLVAGAVTGGILGRDGGGHRGGSDPSSGTWRPSRPTDPSRDGVYGLVGLPAGVGAPVAMDAAAVGDVVWLRDDRGDVARLESGRVTAVRGLGAPVVDLALSPDGAAVYVVLGGAAPALEALDPATLVPLAGRPLAVAALAVAASADAVWVAGAGQVARFGLGDLTALGERALPGVVAVGHLRAGWSATDGHEVLGALVATGDTAARLLGLDAETGALSLGPPLTGTVSVATSQLLTWVSWTPPDAAGNTTLGLDSPLGQGREASAAGLPAGARIWDAGGGFGAFTVVAPGAHAFGCRDPGGFPVSEVDVTPTVPGAVITGQVLRTESAFYVVTDRGLVRSGVGDCA